MSVRQPDQVGEAVSYPGGVLYDVVALNTSRAM